MTAPTMTAADIIRLLGLRPHPEGGHFAETFRDTAEPGKRATSTAIYFLLQAGETSRWHTVDAAEAWHHYAGAPLELTIKAEGGPRQSIRLGKDLLAGERPQAVVPMGAWQMARPLGDWVLVGCTVAPAFEFAGFVLAEPGFEP
jgi:uncharacterized protein